MKRAVAPPVSLATLGEQFEEMSVELFRGLKRPLLMRFQVISEIWIGGSEFDIAPLPPRKPVTVTDLSYLAVRSPETSQSCRV